MARKKNKEMANVLPTPPKVEETKEAPAVVSSTPSLVTPPKLVLSTAPKSALVPKAKVDSGEIPMGLVKELSSDSMMANNPQKISKINGVLHIGGVKVINMFVGNDGKVKYRTEDGKIYI